MSGEMHEVGCWTNYHQVKNRPAFSGLDRTCPKCRGHVDTEWFRLGWKNDLLGLPTESLERKCCRCGYTWRELTAEDSEGRDNAS